MKNIKKLSIKLIVLSFSNKVFLKIIHKPIFQSLDSQKKKKKIQSLLRLGEKKKMSLKLIILSFFNKVFFKIIRKPIFQSLDSPQKKENSNLSVVWGDLCWAYGELPMEKRDILVNTELQRLSQEYSRCNFQKKLKSPKSGKRASRRANLNHHHLIILNQNSLSLSLSLSQGRTYSS